MMTQTRPTELHQRRILMTRRPAAAAEARGQVRAVIRAWEIPVDPDIAVLLTSDLITSAIVRGAGESVTLAVRCSRGRLRIDVYDGSRDQPAGETDAPQTGPGLALIAMLSTAWGCFHTPAGKAVYFTLAFQSDLPARETHQPAKRTCEKHYAQEPARTAEFRFLLDQELPELRQRQLRRGEEPAGRRDRRPQQQGFLRTGPELHLR